MSRARQSATCQEVKAARKSGETGDSKKVSHHGQLTTDKKFNKVPNAQESDTTGVAKSDAAGTKNQHTPDLIISKITERLNPFIENNVWPPKADS